MQQLGVGEVWVACHGHRARACCASNPREVPLRVRDDTGANWSSPNRTKLRIRHRPICSPTPPLAHLSEHWERRPTGWMTAPTQPSNYRLSRPPLCESSQCSPGLRATPSVHRKLHTVSGYPFSPFLHRPPIPPNLPCLSSHPSSATSSLPHRPRCRHPCPCICAPV